MHSFIYSCYLYESEMENLFNIDLTEQPEDATKSTISDDTRKILDKYSKLPSDDEFAQRHSKIPPKSVNIPLKRKGQQ